MYVNQAVSPVLIVLRSQPPLMLCWRRITIRRQSGGGSLHPSPVMSPWTRRSPPDSGRRAFPSTAPAVGITSLEGCDCTLRDRP